MSPLEKTMTIYEKTAIRLGCMIVNQDSENETSAFVFQCPATNKCQNNRCFWKQRDCYGLCPWLVLNNTEHHLEQQNIKDTYGESYFPTWEVYVSTNCMYCYCKEFKK